jgi:anaerobic magnesium-protoporphyrin IX monomethyl ester cyclase
MKILFLMKQPHQEPLGLGHLISAAKKSGHDAEMFLFDHAGDAVRRSLESRPAAIAFSTMTGEHRLYLEINSYLKQKIQFISIFGGPHPTYSPEIIEQPGVDAVCRGEGETALVELLGHIENGKDYSETNNFHFKSGGEIIRNAQSPLVADLDSLPFPDRGSFYQSEPLRVSHLKSFITGRGCPFSCTYCFNHLYNELYRGLGPVVRRRSVDNVIDEVLDVKSRYPLGMIQFMDDIFILRPKWVEEFSEKFPARAGLPFFCNARAELVTPEIVRDLKRAGCHSVCIGIETGDEELRRRMLGRTQTNEQIRLAASLFRASGIKIMTTNMLGIPGGSLDSDLKTYRLNAECRVDYPWASLTYPYPGTRIHSMAMEMGLPVPDADSITHSYFNAMPFDSPDKHKIENLHRLLALAVNFRRLEFIFRALIKSRNRLARGLYTLMFGFWKLYCYETRIFKRRGSWWLFSRDFPPKFKSNVAIGLRMMFPKRKGADSEFAEIAKLR